MGPRRNNPDPDTPSPHLSRYRLFSIKYDNSGGEPREGLPAEALVTVGSGCDIKSEGADLIGRMVEWSVDSFLFEELPVASPHLRELIQAAEGDGGWASAWAALEVVVAKNPSHKSSWPEYGSFVQRRRDLINELAGFDHLEATAALIGLAEKEPDPVVRSEAVQTLASRSSGLAVESLGRCAGEDRTKRVRQAAARALLGRHDPYSDRILERLARHRLQRVRESLVECLGARASDSGARALLARLAQDKSAKVRTVAEKHLR